MSSKAHGTDSFIEQLRLSCITVVNTFGYCYQRWTEDFPERRRQLEREDTNVLFGQKRRKLDGGRSKFYYVNLPLVGQLQSTRTMVVREELSHLVQTTSVKDVSRLVRADSTSVRLLWLVAIVTCSFFGVYQTYFLLSDFLSYSKVTRIKEHYLDTRTWMKRPSPISMYVMIIRPVCCDICRTMRPTQPSIKWRQKRPGVATVPKLTEPPG